MQTQNVTEHCLKCHKVLPLLDKRLNGEELTEKEVEYIRLECRYCRSFDSKGIYKADAILSLLELYIKFTRFKRNTGKKPVRKKQYGAAVQNLRKEGKTIRQIADILGIAKSTVQRILKDL